MTKDLKGERGSKEASIRLSSVTVEAQELDDDGALFGPVIELGRLTVDTEQGTVTLNDRNLSDVGTGWKITMRERGRDSKTTSVKLRFADTVVVDPDPEPTPDTTDPSAPANLRTTLVTANGFTVAWDAATDNVAVSRYEVMVDGDFHTWKDPDDRGSMFVGVPGESYHVQVFALDAAVSVDVKTSAPWTVHIKRNWIGWFYEATEQGSDGPPIVGPSIVAATPEEATHAAKARIDRIVQARRETPEPFEYTPAV